VPSLGAALDLLAELGPRTVHRIFVAGGAQLYAASLPEAERLLITRIVEPAFDDCDTFFPRWTDDPDWRQRPHEALEAWLGDKVPEGLVDDGGVTYRMEMWERERNLDGK
jgi:dihydrofolate reductase